MFRLEFIHNWFNIETFFHSIEKPTETKSPFGNNTAFGSISSIKSPVTNIFGGNTNGNNEVKASPSTGFSFKLPSSTTVTPVTTKEPSVQVPIKSSTPIIAATPEQKPTAPVFGSAGAASFADLAKNTISNETSSPFNSAGPTFATLAQNSSNGSETFSKNSPAGGFFGLSTRDTFANLMQPKNTLNGSATNEPKDEDNENAADDANYDPHYDPIIALPDQIQVSTGEENEEKLFGERAKLYRFDAENKEVNNTSTDCILHFKNAHSSRDPYRNCVHFLSVEGAGCWRIQNTLPFWQRLLPFIAAT